MKRVYLIGYPVSHSVSPEMHKAAFQALGLDWRYELLPTPVDWLPQAVRRLRMDDCIGANVTIPHKQRIMRYLDKVSERALRIGAVNTIINRKGLLIGDNTDSDGFLRPLFDAGIELRGARVVILGAGGAARAVGFALGDSGVASIALINRTVLHAQTLASLLQNQLPDVETSIGDLAEFERADLVVNATSVGMSPKVQASPIPAGAGVRPGSVAYDLVYRPRRTRFLEQAEHSGAATIDGMGMLVQQGAAALALWSNADPPIEIMSRAAEGALLEEQLAFVNRGLYV